MMRGRPNSDPVLFWLALAATVLGMFFIFDAGYARSMAQGRGPFAREFLMQGVYVVVAVLVGAWAARRSPSFWKDWSILFWIVAILGLLMVKVVGVSMNGATRWIGIPGLGNLQPSEFAKLAMVLYLAGALATRKAWPSKLPVVRDLGRRIDAIWIPKLRRLFPLFACLFGIGLIVLEPDLGTALMLIFAAYVMCIAGGITRKSAVIGTIIGIVALFGMVHLEHYRVERFMAHFNRYEGGHYDDVAYQTVQSELAMASGGLFGVGPGAGRAKHIMPAATTDFISTTIAEEFGFAGWLVVVGVLGAITVRLLMNAERCPDRFAQLVQVGVAAWIGSQTLTNLLMANGKLPAIGIPLPFISSGGSSLIALWLAVGVCQSVVARQAVRAKEDAGEAHRHGWWHGRTRLSGS